MLANLSSRQQQVPDQQSTTNLPAKLRQADKHQAATKLPDLATQASPASADQCALPGLVNSSPALGQAGAAGHGPALGSPPPATPSWQGLSAGTPPTPLSSHPIDALDDSESAPSASNSSNLSPAHFDQHPHRSDIQPSGISLVQDKAGISGSTKVSVGHSRDQGIHQQHQLGTNWYRLHQQHNQQQALMLSGQTPVAAKQLGVSSSVDSDAVVLDFGSELSASNNRLISPSSSDASWQRALSQQASDSPQGLTPLPSQDHTSVPSRRHTQNSPGPFWDRADTMSVGASMHSPGLFPDFARMFASSPLPGAWQQHQAAFKEACSPAETDQPQRGEQCSESATAQYTEAAAQLREAIAHAAKLYEASQTAADAQLDLHKPLALDQALTGFRAHPQGCSLQAASDQSQLPYEGFQQPPNRQPFRKAAQPSSLLAAAWVPQADDQSCAASFRLEGRSTSATLEARLLMHQGMRNCCLSNQSLTCLVQWPSSMCLGLADRPTSTGEVQRRASKLMSIA